MLEWQHRGQTIFIDGGSVYESWMAAARAEPEGSGRRLLAELDADTQRTRYEFAVETVLENVTRRPCGDLVLRSVLSKGKRITIVPGESVAKTSTRPSNWRDPLPLNAKNICTVPYGAPDQGLGTGIGADATIFYSPKHFKGATEAGKAQDEALLHELVHAYQIATGTLSCESHGHNMITVDEVVAIAIVNIYALQGNRPLRKDHGLSFAAIPENGENKWLANMRDPIREFCERERPFALQLAKMVPFGFNPFRASIPMPGMIRF
jgi:hypothetical protein